MTRGRRPDPAAVQAAKGNPRKRSRKTLEAMQRAEAPADDGKPVEVPDAGHAAPKELNAGARRIWSTLAPELTRLRFLRSTDVEPFKRYCVNLARWWDNQSKIDGLDMTYETQSAHGNLQRIHPLFIVQMHLEKRLTDFEDRFGLNPQARQRILLTMANRQPDLPGLGALKDNDAEGKTEGGAETPQPPEGGSPIGILARVH